MESGVPLAQNVKSKSPQPIFDSMKIEEQKQSGVPGMKPNFKLKLPTNYVEKEQQSIPK